MAAISNMDIFGKKLTPNPSKPHAPTSATKLPPSNTMQKAETYLRTDQISDFVQLSNANKFATQQAGPAAISGMISSFPIEKSILKKELAAAKQANGEKVEPEKKGNLLDRFRLFADEGNRYTLLTGTTLNLLEHFTEGGMLGVILTSLGGYMGWFENHGRIKNPIFGPLLNPIINLVCPIQVKKAEGLLADGKRYAVQTVDNTKQIFHAGPLAKLFPWLHNKPVAEIVEKDGGAHIITLFKKGTNEAEKIITIGNGSTMGTIETIAEKAKQDFRINGGEIVETITKTGKNIAETIAEPLKNTDNIFVGLYRYTNKIFQNIMKGPGKIAANIESGLHKCMNPEAEKLSEGLTKTIKTFLPEAIKNISSSGNEGIFKLLKFIPPFERVVAGFTFGGILALLYNLLEHGAVKINMPGVSTGGGHGE